jgi:uncharacterized Zn finger protein
MEKTKRIDRKELIERRRQLERGSWNCGDETYLNEMKKVKEGYRKCENCGRFKLDIIKSEKYYKIYECKNCNSRYKAPVISTHELLIEIVNFIKKHWSKVYIGTPRVQKEDTYYIDYNSRFGNNIEFLLRFNDKILEIHQDLTKPDFDQIYEKINNTQTN